MCRFNLAVSFFPAGGLHDTVTISCFLFRDKNAFELAVSRVNAEMPIQFKSMSQVFDLRCFCRHKNADMNCAGSNKDHLLQVFHQQADDERTPPEYRMFMKTAAQTLDELKKESDQDQERIAQLQEEVKVYSEYLITASKNYDELEEFLKKERRTRLDLESKVEELQRELEAERQKKNESNAEANKLLSDQLDVQTKENAALLAENAKLRADNEQLNRAVTEMESLRAEQMRSERLAQEVNKLKADIAKLQKEKEDTEVKCSRIASGRRSMEEKLLQQYRDVLAWQKKVSDLEPEVQQLRTTVQIHAQQIRQKDIQIANAKAEFDKTKQMYIEVLRRFAPDVQKELERIQSLVNSGALPMTGSPLNNLVLNGANTTSGKRPPSSINR